MALAGGGGQGAWREGGIQSRSCVRVCSMPPGIHRKDTLHQRSEDDTDSASEGKKKVSLVSATKKQETARGLLGGTSGYVEGRLKCVHLLCRRDWGASWPSIMFRLEVVTLII
jgi:hypothetical protein